MNRKIPQYLLGKYQLIGTVTFSVLFALVYLNISIPFSDTAWFGLRDSVMFLFTLVFVAISILTLIVSRMLMYQSKRYFDLTFLTYTLWCIIEILTIAGLYTYLTVDVIDTDGTLLETMRKSVTNGFVALGIPYLISGMYFAIIDKNNTIRLMNYENVVTDEPQKADTSLKKITLFDNSGTLKLSVSPDNLYYIESDDNYIKVWYQDSNDELKQYMLRCRLKTIEESFADSDLVRCHRKYIVNINKIEQMTRQKDGTFSIDLGLQKIMEPISVSKTYEESFFARFNSR